MKDFFVSGGKTAVILGIFVVTVLSDVTLSSARSPSSDWDATNISLTNLRKYYLNGEWCHQNIPDTIVSLNDALSDAKQRETSVAALRSCLYVLSGFQQMLHRKSSALPVSSFLVAIPRVMVQPSDKTFEPDLADIAFVQLDRPTSYQWRGPNHPYQQLRRFYFDEIPRRWNALLQQVDQNSFTPSTLRFGVESAFSRVTDQLLKQAGDFAMGRVAMNGLLTMLFDDHTKLYTTTMFESHKQKAQEVPGTLGLQALPHRDGIIVNRVMPGSRAELAGLKACDVITELDGENPHHGTENSIYYQLKGLHGEKVRVSYRSSQPGADQKIVQKELEKTVLTESSLTSLRIEQSNGKAPGRSYLVIRLDEFYRGSGKDLRQLVEQEMQKNFIDGIILDLTMNGGGFVDDAVEIADVFLEAGGPVVFRGPPGSRPEDLVNFAGRLNFTKKPMLYSGPLVVLQSRYSASASELLAGALADYERAYIVGEQSYGKGSVQRYIDGDTEVSRELWLMSIGSRIKLPHHFMGPIVLAKTESQFYQVNGETNDGVGIDPHFEREFSKGSGIMTEAYGASRSMHPATPGRKEVLNTPDLYLESCVSNLEPSVTNWLSLSPGIEPYSCDLRAATAVSIIQCLNQSYLSSTGRQHEK